MTNADMIRSMSDDELAYFLSQWGTATRIWQKDPVRRCTGSSSQRRKLTMIDLTTLGKYRQHDFERREYGCNGDSGNGVFKVMISQ